MVTTWLRVEEELGASVAELCSRVSIVTDTVQEEARNIEKISADIAKLETEDTELKVHRGGICQLPLMQRYSSYILLLSLHGGMDDNV